MSIQQSCVPKAWKVAKVIPIFKGNSSMLEVKNYRPINLTNVTVKPWRDLFAEKLCPLGVGNLTRSGFRSALSSLKHN